MDIFVRHHRVAWPVRDVALEVAPAAPALVCRSSNPDVLEGGRARWRIALKLQGCPTLVETLKQSDPWPASVGHHHTHWRPSGRRTKLRGFPHSRRIAPFLDLSLSCSWFSIRRDHFRYETFPSFKKGQLSSASVTPNNIDAALDE